MIDIDDFAKDISILHLMVVEEKISTWPYACEGNKTAALLYGIQQHYVLVVEEMEA
ncbi:hypothetical protein ACF0H5_008864 [Mactra antiquata]